MGAMAPPPHWVPEDDVLLRNAVEAGASLESLAKGAVQFSRRFTVQELQDRWFSLLYDPVVSVEASADMIEVERSSFLNQPGLNKLEGRKDTACSSRKRKAESVRKRYYAMRKRICNEPLDMMGINLLPGPVYSNVGDGNEIQTAGCGMGNPVPDNMAIEGPNFDTRYQSLPEFCLHVSRCTSSVVPPSLSGIHNHCQDLQFAGNDGSHNLAYPYEENIALTEACSEVPGFGQPNDLPLHNLFEAGGIVNEGSACPEFGGLPFNSFECSSPLPQMPTWHTSQEISATGLPVQIGEGDEQANPEDYLAELSSALFDLADTDQQLLMDNDVRDTFEKYGLGSLLLDSPCQSELPTDGLGEAPGATGGHLVDTSGAHNGRSDKVPDVRVALSVSNMKNLGPEYRNGVICCTLNTEDPDIPSNDDVFLPFRCPSPRNSSANWRLHDLVPPSVSNYASTQKTYGGPLTSRDNPKDSCMPARKTGSSHLSDMGLRCPIGDHGMKFELPKSNIEHAAPRNARKNECSNLLGAENVNANNIVAGTFKGGSMVMEQQKNTDYKSLGHCPVKRESGSGIESLQMNINGNRSGLGVEAEIPNNGSSNADSSFQQSVVPKSIEQSLLPDQDEPWSDNEFDIPYFSDVEAMILDMDLTPDEFDLHTNPAVKRYQHEESKRTIVRLEQAADAFTHRTMASQDAFAVLSGRCSKYFVKKPEVLLGRATEDVKVDIDLGREKDGSKISRRQAILKMDMNGIFHLRNLGKSSVYVNGKEVASRQSLNLTSGCLLEVRGLTFLFETNRNSIKQYVDGFGGGGLLVDQKPSR